MRLNAPAIIHLATNVAGVRVAAFTWHTATGVAWLEPDYLEPEPPPRPAFHHFAGEVREHANGATVYGADGLVLVQDAEASAGDDALVPPEAAAALARLRELLELAGTTWGAERARVSELLADDLAAHGGVVA